MLLADENMKPIPPHCARRDHVGFGVLPERVDVRDEQDGPPSVERGVGTGGTPGTPGTPQGRRKRCRGLARTPAGAANPWRRVPATSPPAKRCQGLARRLRQWGTWDLREDFGSGGPEGGLREETPEGKCSIEGRSDLLESGRKRWRSEGATGLHGGSGNSDYGTTWRSVWKIDPLPRLISAV